MYIIGIDGEYFKEFNFFLSNTHGRHPGGEVHEERRHICLPLEVANLFLFLLLSILITFFHLPSIDIYSNIQVVKGSADANHVAGVTDQDDQMM